VHVPTLRVRPSSGPAKPRASPARLLSGLFRAPPGAAPSVRGASALDAVPARTGMIFANFVGASVYAPSMTGRRSRTTARAAILSEWRISTDCARTSCLTYSTQRRATSRPAARQKSMSKVGHRHAPPFQERSKQGRSRKVQSVDARAKYATSDPAPEPPPRRRHVPVRTSPSMMKSATMRSRPLKAQPGSWAWSRAPSVVAGTAAPRSRKTAPRPDRAPRSRPTSRVPLHCRVRTR